MAAEIEWKLRSFQLVFSYSWDGYDVVNSANSINWSCHAVPGTSEICMTYDLFTILKG
jgi:hypothetical protein